MKFAWMGPSSTSGQLPGTLAGASVRFVDTKIILLLTMALSLALHLGLFWMCRDLAMMGLTLSKQQHQAKQYSISRLNVAQQRAHLARRAGLFDQMDPLALDNDQALEQLSERLLEQAIVQVPPSAHATQNLFVERDRPQKPQDARSADLAIAPVATSTLPANAKQHLQAALNLPPADLPFTQTSDPATGLSVGHLPYAMASSTADGPLAANHLLAADQLRPIAIAQRASVSSTPAFSTLSAGDTRHSYQLVQTQSIDFSQSTLDFATDLKVPQYLDNDFEYALFTHRPKRSWGKYPDGPQGYFRVDVRAKRSLRKLKTMPKDVIYLIDTSDSISQTWVHNIIRGVKDALNSLNPSDRFNIVLFKDSPAFFQSQGIAQASLGNIQAARTFLTQAKSSGYTDVNQALSRLLVRDIEQQRVYYLILISDGIPTRGTRDTRQLINMITRDNDLAASIYCVGVGNKQNQQLLEFLAYRNKGLCVFAKNARGATGAIHDLAARLRYPIIKNVTIAVSGLDGQAVYPKHIPNIHQGELFHLFGRFARRRQFTMQIHGSNQSKQVAFTFSKDIAKANPGNKQIAQNWALWKLHHLYSEQIRQGSDKQILTQIRQLSHTYDLKTVY